MNDDTACSLAEVRTSVNEPLCLRVLDIQARAQLIQGKSAMRRCVQVAGANNTPKGEDPIELRHDTSDHYIAVSCPWYLPNHNTVSGRYIFEGGVTPPGVVMPPDAVLDRVLNFKSCNAEYTQTPIWVDKLCINQDASDEKEMAIHSMDLVYQYSARRVNSSPKETIGCSLGLLFVRIETVTQLTMLRRLLDSNYAEYVRNEPRLLVSVEEATEVLGLIEMILQDNWWHRAWIFQEEFLASRHMILLLPCDIDRGGMFEEEDGVDLFGRTTGEIKVHAMNFRTEATIFALALGRLADQVGQDRCSNVLKYARRYTFLYRSRIATSPSSVVRAMSPAIFEDISTRGITVPSDILAITANCCRYTIRLDAKILNDTRESLSLAVLTMFMVNGEIVRHDVPDMIPGENVFECLKRVKLEVYPPVQCAELIFIKHCRLPSITMGSHGSMVRGVLSRLDKKIRIYVPEEDLEFYWRTNNATEMKTLDEAERRLLRILAHDLSRRSVDGGMALPGLLRMFVDRWKDDGVAQYWSQQHIMTMMAKCVCRAMAKRRPLWMARVHEQGKWTPWLGIFVPDDVFDDSFGVDGYGVVDRPNVISFAFTSVESNNEFTYRENTLDLARKNVNVTSLEVRMDPKAKQLMPRKWMNGLCFFNNKSHPGNYIIPWPKWMQEL